MTLPTSEELLKQIMLTVDIAWRNQLDFTVINKWLDNFRGEALGDPDEEKNLALWLLYNFVYINEEELKHLCRLLLKKYVRNSIGSNSTNIKEITEVLKRTKFTGLGKLSESGGYVLYLFRQENDLPIRFFNEGNEEVDYTNCVFLDYMTFSGNQAIDRIQRVKYDGHKFHENDIKNSFLDKLQTFKNDGELTCYIWKKLNCNKRDKKKIAKYLNDNIVTDLKFFQNTKDYFKVKEKNEQIELLIEKYQKEELCDLGIYKLNRLLLETYYSDDLEKGINNLDIKKWTLLSFVASEEAIEKLKREDVEVIYCILMDDMSKAFSETSLVFKSFPEEKERCRDMCQYYGKKIKAEYPMGYNEGQLLFGLYYTIPNNTLPVFWCNNNWTPLFVRHEKNYTGGIKDVFGKYI